MEARSPPSTSRRTVPSGSFSICSTRATVPTGWMSSAAGSSSRSVFWVARKRCLPPFMASSTARTERRRPTKKGTIMWGNTTMSRSGTRQSSVRGGNTFMRSFFR